MEKIPKVYQQRNTFYYKIVVDGQRVTRKAPGETLAQAQRHVDKMFRTGKESSKTLAWVVAKFCDPDTNPRFRDAKITGKQYTARYAGMIASRADELDAMLGKGLPGIYRKPIETLTRKDCRDIMYYLVKQEGVSYRAMNFFKLLKICFGYAADEGIIPVNPAQGLPDIHPKKTREKKPVSSADIVRLLSEGRWYSSQEERDIFALLACTGMRIGELAALSIPQYDKENGILTIDRAMKDYNYREVGLPKWGCCRVIPLPKLCTDAMRRLCRASSDGRLFHYRQGGVERMLKRISANALVAGEWETPEAIKEMTPHILRHSLNTNLRINGSLPDLVIAEYLSWQHQPENAVQKGYTHLYAENLRPVADLIDEMYGPQEHGIVIQFPMSK